MEKSAQRPRKNPPPRRVARPKAAPEPEANGRATLAGDLLYGAEAIAAWLDWPIRRVRHQLARGYIPVTKQGLIFVASKSRLRRHFQGEAAEQ